MHTIRKRRYHIAAISVGSNPMCKKKINYFGQKSVHY